MTRLIPTALQALVISLFAFSAEGAHASICVGDASCYSPITKGYWAWPRTKPSGKAAILEACRSAVAFVADDGSYFTLRFSPAGRPQLVEQGTCKYTTANQTERCDHVVFSADAKPDIGFIESQYSKQEGGTLKATVKGQYTDGPKKGESAEFEMYPVSCPASFVQDRMRSYFSPSKPNER